MSPVWPWLPLLARRRRVGQARRAHRESARSLNERFTQLADLVSEAMGQWWVTAISLVAVLGWLALGPVMRWSDSWQLLINTPTTVLELFIGFLLAAAANRSERRNRELLELIQRLVQREQEELEVVEQELASIETTIETITPAESTER